MPRQALFDYLSTLPIDQHVVHILTEWHSSTSYVILHDSAYHSTCTGRGVRQGCRVAPILWAAYMNLMFKRASDQVSVQWVKQVLTLFADDLHQGMIFLLGITAVHIIATDWFYS